MNTSVSMVEKQLIVAVEGTAAMGPFWSAILSDYLEKIIWSFCGNDGAGEKPSTTYTELLLVTFNSHGSYSACQVQRSGWTRDVDIFLQWLSAIPFTGGGFNDAAIAEGLSEALMMFPNGSQVQQNIDGQKHCILIAASNPHPLPTLVYHPQLQNLEQGENIDARAECRLSDAETVAKAFPHTSVSLSVICPKQLPKLKAIYDAGKRNARATDPPVGNVKNPHFLVLISEDFMEARTALSHPGIPSLPSNQSPVKADVSSVTSATGPPPGSIPSANGSLMNQPPVSVGNIPTATIKVEPGTVTSMAIGPTFPHMPSFPHPSPQGVLTLQTSSPLSTSQDLIAGSENMQDTKPSVGGMSQSLRSVPPPAANVNILNNLSQARQVVNSAVLNAGTSIGLSSMNQTPVAMQMSNMISSGIVSSIPAAQNVISSGRPGIASVTASGTLTGTSQVTQNTGLGPYTSANSNISGNSNLGISQPMSNIQGGVSMGQSVQSMGQGNPSGQMVQSGVGMNQNMVSNLVPSGVSSASTMIPTPGISQPIQSGMQSLGVSNNSTTMPLSQQSTSALQSSQSKYVKVWEGNLSGQRQGQPVFITRLEGYRSTSASETLAANWPPTMQIVRLISQDHMNNKQYVGKADFLVFRAMNQHGFLGQLQEKKLCAVIQLPSQTLLLSVSDKAYRLIGMLFPGDMVVFKPQHPSQQQQQQQQHQHQQMQPQQHPQLQQQQLPQLQQQQLPQLQQQQQLPQLQQQPSQLQQPQQLPQLQQQQQLQNQQQLPQLQQQQLQHLQQIPQMQQQQLQHQQQLPQLQQQALPQLPQQQQQQQQMVGTGMGQGYVHVPGRSQLVSQGQSQGPSNMPGGSYMS